MSTRGLPDWEDFYRAQPGESMPWYYPHLDPDLERALAQHALTSARVLGRRFLDLGTGPATQAIALAELGYDVTASDLSKAAVEAARARSSSTNLRLVFVHDDILSTQLEPGFDYALDRGCFHVLSPDARERYAQTLASLIKPEGLLFLKCFSDEQPGELGPYKFSPQELENIFQTSFDVLSIDRTVYHGTFVPPPKALFCVLRRAPRGA